MLRDAVRGVTVLAVELAEETGKRVVGTAAGLLERSGVDVAAIERTVAEQFPPSVRSLQMLAGEAVTVGRAGLDLAVGTARAEAEKIFELVGDQVVKVGVVLGYLESRLREVEEEHPAPAAKPEARAGDLFGVGWEAEAESEIAAEEAEEAAPPEPVAEEPVPVPEPTKKAAPVKKKAAAKKVAVKKPAAKKAAPRKKTAPDADV
ncbi:hypothetical protein [Kitasatospora sp. MAP5-34]|uniref:hypothetical protein n=1 Tax=Kitasatospora sp. MAP5-34 TaxID=3035102 RepID=UPI002473006C|nr:hypothetical protein [Kitasatospora sp. MAP5-34]MDH6579343.1 hypothetical protein [Kitasatospora sp. MAP5-34]